MFNPMKKQSSIGSGVRAGQNWREVHCENYSSELRTEMKPDSREILLRHLQHISRIG